ncbi:transaldolase [Streptacidiphilus pinicola]|nr:transaldolase [Streptacidiphilus pinicola]
MTVPLARLRDAGVAVRLDAIGRGSLGRFAGTHQVQGARTNPVVLKAAVESSALYDREIAELALTGVGIGDAMRSLTACDARWACDVLRPVFDATGGVDGWVSIEIDPRLAHDEARMLAEARTLWRLVDRPNLLTQVPATEAGLRAASACLAEGICVDVTWIFSPGAYARVRDAFLTGLERAVRNGRGPARIASLASYEVAPVDTAVDARLDQLGTSRARHLLGDAAIAGARLAYQGFERMLAGPRWKALEQAGARPQRLAWTSTSIEDPAYEDTRYVEGLVAPDTVCTMSQALLYAVADHGLVPQDSVHGRYPAAREVLDELDSVAVDHGAVTRTLQRRALSEAGARWASLAELVGTLMNGQVARHSAGTPTRVGTATGESSV